MYVIPYERTAIEKSISCTDQVENLLKAEVKSSLILYPFVKNVPSKKKPKKHPQTPWCFFPGFPKLIHVEEKKKIRIKFQILNSNAGLMSFMSKPKRLSGI